jgi:hypothetical protein
MTSDLYGPLKLKPETWKCPQHTQYGDDSYCVALCTDNPAIATEDDPCYECGNLHVRCICGQSEGICFGGEHRPQQCKYKS